MQDYHLACFQCEDCQVVLSPGTRGRECWYRTSLHSTLYCSTAVQAYPAPPTLLRLLQAAPVRVRGGVRLTRPGYFTYIMHKLIKTFILSLTFSWCLTRQLCCRVPDRSASAPVLPAATGSQIVFSLIRDFNVSGRCGGWRGGCFWLAELRSASPRNTNVTK